MAGLDSYGTWREGTHDDLVLFVALGKTPGGVLDITGEAILERLRGLPEADRHCAYLAADTLQEALSDFMIKQTEK